MVDLSYHHGVKLVESADTPAILRVTRSGITYVNGIAPDVSLPTILWGALPFVLCMVLGIVLLCIFPQIALWLPDALMGPGL